MQAIGIFYTMTLHQLKIFQVVAKHKNFTRAGEELYLSQPAVSIQIKELETELGIKLFDQIGKKIYLSEAGKILEGYTNKIFRVVSETRQAIEDLKGVQKGHLRIGASTTIAICLLPHFLAKFKKEYPLIELQVGVENTSSIEEKILSNELDIGFVGGHLVSDDLIVEPFYNEEMVVVVGSKHPFVKKKRVTLKELRGERFILREKGSATRYFAEKKFRELKEELNIYLELGGPETVKRAVEEGLGITIISECIVGHELESKKLFKIEVDGLKICRTLNITYHKDKRLSIASEKFLAMVKESIMPTNRCKGE